MYKEGKGRTAAFCHAGQQCQGFLGGQGIGLNRGGSKKTVSGRWAATAAVAGAFTAGPLAFGAALMGTTLAGWAMGWTGLPVLAGETWPGVCKPETGGASGVLKREADQTSWFTRPILLHAPVAWMAWSPETRRWRGGRRRGCQKRNSWWRSGRKGWLERLVDSTPSGGAVGAVKTEAEGGRSRLPRLPQVSSSELD